MTFSWEISTTPVPVSGFKPTSTVVVDSTKVTPEKLKALEDKVYGASAGESAMPTPDEIKQLLTA